MPAKTREQRLFGAACLKLTLERTHGERAAAVEIYEETLRDLGLSGEEVDAYLARERARVVVALAARRMPRAKSGTAAGRDEDEGE